MAFVREKLVELFYDNNVMCDQKIEGLAELRLCSFSRRYVLRIVGTVRMVRHRYVHLVLGKEGHGVL